MTGLLVAIVAALLAALIQAAILERRKGLLRAKEQCFKFHELRDKLQILAVDGKINRNSAVYDFLLHTINLSIRNAGFMKLGELLQMSSALKKEVESQAFVSVASEMRSATPEVQLVASEVFDTFAKMLVANDDFTYWIFAALEVTTKVANSAPARGFLSVNRMVFKSIVQALSPRRAEVVREARGYQRLGRRIAAASC
jgi:hypothetical protein